MSVAHMGVTEDAPGPFAVEDFLSSPMKFHTQIFIIFNFLGHSFQASNSLKTCFVLLQK